MARARQVLHELRTVDDELPTSLTDRGVETSGMPKVGDEIGHRIVFWIGHCLLL